jgi:hypothetical protein
MSVLSNSVIPTFPGILTHNEAISEWVKKTRGFANSRDILGITYDAAEWAIHPNNPTGDIFQIPQRPQVPAVNASTTQISRYQILDKRYEAYFKAHNELRDAILISVKDDTRTLALFEDIGMEPISSIIAKMEAEFKQWLPKEIDKLHGDLTSPWCPSPTSTIHDHINHQKRLYKILADNGVPVADTRKIDYFMTSIRESKLYDTWWQYWEIQHPSIVSRTFESFLSDIKKYTPNIQLQNHHLGYTSDSNNTGNNVALLSSTSNKSEQRAKRKRGANGENKMFCFCYTHGFNFSHWSKECERPCADHISTATKPPKGWKPKSDP